MIRICRALAGAGAMLVFILAAILLAPMWFLLFIWEVLFVDWTDETEIF